MSAERQRTRRGCCHDPKRYRDADLPVDQRRPDRGRSDPRAGDRTGRHDPGTPTGRHRRRAPGRRRRTGPIFSPGSTSSTTRTAPSPPGSPPHSAPPPPPRSTHPKGTDHEPQAHRSPAHRRCRARQRRVHRARHGVQLPRHPQGAGRRHPRRVPGVASGRDRLVRGARPVLRPVRADRHRRRPALRPSRDADRGAGRHRGRGRPGDRPVPLAAARSRVRRGRRERRSGRRRRRDAVLRHRAPHPRQPDRRDLRLPVHRGLDAAGAAGAEPA